MTGRDEIILPDGRVLPLEPEDGPDDVPGDAASDGQPAPKDGVPVAVRSHRRTRDRRRNARTDTCGGVVDVST
ncbi:MAG: hypothetical protein AAFX81_01190 [Pseudomonadota bacterium]